MRESTVSPWRSRNSLLSRLSKPLFPPLPQTLQKEIQGHQPRIDDIFERSQSIVTDSSSLNAEAIRRRLADLKELWGLLIEETEKRHRRLEEAHRAQQYYFDAAEAEAWMSEQELYMMSEEKAKVREVSSPALESLRLPPQACSLLVTVCL